MPTVPPFLWSDSGTFPSPVTYTVPGAGEVQPYTATATYVNGSGQAILPALRIRSAEGALLALVFPAGQIADGASSEVTFVPPFGSAASDSEGIRFNTDNQGGFLNITTNAADPLTGWGARLFDPSGGGILIDSGNGGDTDILVDGTLREEARYITLTSLNAAVELFGKTAVTLTSQHTGGSLNAVQVITNDDDSFSHKDATSGAILFQSTTHGVWDFLRAGGTFTLFDHNNVAILQVEEAGPAYRIKTGHAWVANL